ncbi:DNA methyltransferase [Shigella phage vB_SflS-ISF001]|uniref:DNA methylase n=1 Tax=Shigella phage vB_SflS-ISF001 TaxID=2048005 RepID=A0A2D1GQA4_9CAUD|nr:DNA methyltransferase [Shigella phage vB_SflS-ISF001]ATN94145.1 DNA methylase [Shigella phage vB_SflS-ISF001]
MKLIWSLYDGSGLANLELAKQGHKVMCFNWDGADHGVYAKYNARVERHNIEYVNVFINEKFERDATAPVYGKPDLIRAFPQCTDLAVSGAGHFVRKRERDPLFQEKAVATAGIAANIGDSLGVTYIFENPVSVLSSAWRKPNHSFNPWEYGGYLPENDAHPKFPMYIAPRDRYPKKTCLWTSDDFVTPEKKKVSLPDGYSTHHSKQGSKSVKTKLIRSLSQRGFFPAIANSTFC